MLPFLRKIVFPFSLIYAVIIHIRNFLFDIGIFKSVSFQTPTICIGNLSVGGTGKTPMIEYLVRNMEVSNIAVLSRGYKRKSSGFVLAGPDSTVADLGDEPFQLHKKFPVLSVAVDADRRNGIQQLETLIKPDVILLDDAFQHRKVKATFNILLTSYQNLYPRDWYLPTGDLRDSKREARRANLIIVTKCPQGLTASEKAEIVQRLKPQSNQKVLFSSLGYAAAFKNAQGKMVDAKVLSKQHLALVTGIASPEPLVEHLKSLGMEFQHLAFGDHHNFTTGDIEKLKRFDAILTTEKDFVRLDGKLAELFYLEVAHTFGAEDGERLQEALRNLV
nr:tetraacyldisaccharide 4'-kinase [Allomuricauda sp.]